MLADFLQKLIDVSKAAQQPVKIADPHAHCDRYIMRDGNEVVVMHPEKPKACLALDRESLVSATSDRLLTYSCTAFINPEGVSVYSDAYDEQTVCLAFDRMTTTAWRSFPHGSVLRLTQREMIDWIREKMDGTGLDVLLPMLRSVEFTRAEQSAGVVQRGKESLGRSVEAAVGNAESFPNSAEFTVSMLSQASGFHLPVSLTLNIEPLASEQKFKVWVNSDPCADAMWASMRHVARCIENDITHIRSLSDIPEMMGLTVLLGERQ